MCGGPGCINEAVAAYFFRFRDGKCHAEITFGCDEQRFCAEQITDTFLQKRQNRRNNAGNDDAPKVGRGKILVFKKLLDRRFILAGRPGVVDVNPGCEFEEYACCGAVRTPPSVTVVFPISMAKIIKIPRDYFKSRALLSFYYKAFLHQWQTGLVVICFSVCYT